MCSNSPIERMRAASRFWLVSRITWPPPSARAERIRRMPFNRLSSKREKLSSNMTGGQPFGDRSDASYRRTLIYTRSEVPALMKSTEWRSPSVAVKDIERSCPTATSRYLPPVAFSMIFPESAESRGDISPRSDSDAFVRASDAQTIAR